MSVTMFKLCPVDDIRQGDACRNDNEVGLHNVRESMVGSRCHDYPDYVFYRPSNPEAYAKSTQETALKRIHTAAHFLESKPSRSNLEGALQAMDEAQEVIEYLILQSEVACKGVLGNE